MNDKIILNKGTHENAEQNFVSELTVLQPSHIQNKKGAAKEELTVVSE